MSNDSAANNDNVISSSNGTLDISYTSSKWDYINVTRKFVEEYLKLNFLKNEDISKVILCVSEMLENALKYSINGTIKIHLEKDVDNNQLIFIVKNKADQDNAARAKQIIDEMNAASDPFQYYMAKLKNKKTKTVSGGV